MKRKRSWTGRGRAWTICARNLVACLAATSLTGCALLEAIGPVASSVSAWYSYQASNRPLIAPDCVWAQAIAPNDASLAVMDRESLEALVLHNQMVRESCGRAAASASASVANSVSGSDQTK